MSGASRDTTNNRMEMFAVIRGLEFLIQEQAVSPIEVTSDSQYVIRGVNEWCKKWKANEWHRKDEKGRWVPIINPDLWKLLHGLAHVTLAGRCKFTWTRGHVGTHYNELCDKLAGEAAWRLIEGA
jgi:ribonuclease HI